jgi:hypothetical protein
MGLIVGKPFFLVIIFVAVMGNSLFAHERGDIFISPQAGAGLEIPNIHLENEYPKGDYVSLGVDWGARVTAGYYFLTWLGVETGIGFGGFYDRNNYNSRDTAALTETHDYNAGYLIIPVGFRVNRGHFAAGAGLTGHIPVFFNFSGVSRQQAADKPTIITDIEDDSFRIHSFLGGYIDIGYDWAGLEDKRSGFGAYVRAQFPFDKNIGESDTGFTAFQHAGLSLIVSYCFAVARFPKN